MTLSELSNTSTSSQFSPPILRGYDASYICQTVRRILLLVCTIAIVIAAILIAFGDLRLILPVGAILLTQLLGLLFWRTQQLQRATQLVPIGFFIGATWAAVNVGEYSILLPGFYGLTIIIAGALLSKRAALLMTLAAFVCGLAVYTYQTSLGVSVANNPIYLFYSAVQVLLFALTINLILFYMNRNYQRLVRSYNALAEAQDTLHQHTDDLERANTALTHSQQTKQAILDSIPDMMAVMSKDGHYLDYKALSYFRNEDPPESVIGRTANDLLSPEMARKRLALIARALETGEVLEYQESQSVRGELHHFATRLMAINENAVLVMMRDITREKEREQIELATQKLESIGLLASGIAHDFNNLLTGMMAQTSLALRKLPSKHPATRHIEKATVASERAAHLTRQLLAYTGQGQFKLTAVSLNDILLENVDFLQAGLPRPINIQLQLEPRLPTITADIGQMQQLVMNLIINAAEASSQDNARVTIQTQIVAQATVTEALKNSPHPQPDPTAVRYLCLSVADSGVGMPPEIIQKVFDPFFSTKGQGRGLGLSAIWGIIRSYNGFIHIDSVPNTGTTFTVFLPFEQAEMNHAPNLTQPLTTSATRHIDKKGPNQPLKESVQPAKKQSDWQL